MGNARASESVVVGGRSNHHPDDHWGTTTWGDNLPATSLQPRRPPTTSSQSLGCGCSAAISYSRCFSVWHEACQGCLQRHSACYLPSPLYIAIDPVFSNRFNPNKNAIARTYILLLWLSQTACAPFVISSLLLLSFWCPLSHPFSRPL